MGCFLRSATSYVQRNGKHARTRLLKYSARVGQYAGHRSGATRESNHYQAAKMKMLPRMSAKKTSVHLRCLSLS